MRATLRAVLPSFPLSSYTVPQRSRIHWTALAVNIQQPRRNRCEEVPLPAAERLLFGMAKGRRHLDWPALVLGAAEEAGLSPQG